LIFVKARCRRGLWGVDRIASSTAGVETAKRTGPAKVPDFSNNVQNRTAPAQRPSYSRHLFGWYGSLLVYAGRRGSDDKGRILTAAAFTSKLIGLFAGVCEAFIERGSRVVTVAAWSVKVMVLVIVGLVEVGEVVMHRGRRAMGCLGDLDASMLYFWVSSFAMTGDRNGPI
jgi:hypothetical protein